MILPIVAYGEAVLRKVAKDIDVDYPKLKELIANMWDTMYNAHGVGLAAPQIGLPIRLFLVDTTPFADDEDLSPEEQKALDIDDQTNLSHRDKQSARSIRRRSFKIEKSKFDHIQFIDQHCCKI